jgi:methionine synthase II (cobalamin-independent)
MLAQYSEGFPGMSVDNEGSHLTQDEAFELSLERLYEAYDNSDPAEYAMSSDYAAGLSAFLAMGEGTFKVVKGQVTGPITWGMSASNQEGLPLIYDDAVAEAVPMFLRLKAAWQEEALGRIADTTIVFVDEPSLSFLGTAGVALSPDQVVDLMDQVLGGIAGLKGTHCCGEADWPLVLRTSIDILNFDAYNYAGSLALYPTEVKVLLDRGGSIAWGIVPSDEEALPKETVASLKDRLEEAMAPFTRSGVPYNTLIEQSLLTPSCGVASLSPEAAEHALELLADLSTQIRKQRVL